jgi:hypothetical protein
MPIKAREFDRMIDKFGFETRDGRDLLAWLKYNGKTVVKTKRSKGSGDLPMEYSMRSQLKLNESQFNEARRCVMTKNQYIAILKEKKVI